MPLVENRFRAGRFGGKAEIFDHKMQCLISEKQQDITIINSPQMLISGQNISYRENYMNEFTNCLEKAAVLINDEKQNIGGLEWHKHPSFKGVYLKHIIKGESTDNRLSIHLVKIEKNCEIGRHIHDKKLEVHTVICGRGSLIMDGRTTEYYPGVCSLIPDNLFHTVRAFDEDMYILAKFTGALI